MDTAVEELVRQIIQTHPTLAKVVLIGLLPSGYLIAQRLQKRLQKTAEVLLPLGKMDVSLYRDDLSTGTQFVTIQPSEIPFDINKKKLILVDTVLTSGRTVQAALNGIQDFGRPATVELAVLIDRGFREMPLQPNFVGQHIKTRKRDKLEVRLFEIDGEDGIHVSP